jgi:hypothetical protein
VAAGQQARFGNPHAIFIAAELYLGDWHDHGAETITRRESVVKRTFGGISHSWLRTPNKTAPPVAAPLPHTTAASRPTRLTGAPSPRRSDLDSRLLSELSRVRETPSADGNPVATVLLAAPSLSFVVRFRCSTT